MQGFMILAIKDGCMDGRNNGRTDEQMEGKLNNYIAPCFKQVR